jgi:hypothetical protein
MESVMDIIIKADIVDVKNISFFWYCDEKRNHQGVYNILD